MMFIHHSDSFVSRLMSSSQASAGPWNKNLKILTWKFYSSKLHAFKTRRRRTTLSVPSVVSFLYVRIFPVLTRHSFPDFDCPCPPRSVQNTSWTAIIDDLPWQRNRHLHWVCNQFFLAISFAFAGDSKFETFSSPTDDRVDL